MLLMNVKRGPYQIGNRAKDEFKAHIEFDITRRSISLALHSADDKFSKTG